MNRRKVLAVSSSSVLLGVGGCLESTFLEPDEPTNTSDEGGTGDNENGDQEDPQFDENPPPHLDKIRYLIDKESNYSQDGVRKRISRTGPTVTDPVEPSGNLHALLVNRSPATGTSLTVDLHQVDADESEKRLLQLEGGTSTWYYGSTCFLPPEEAYQLDVQTEESLDWNLTVVDLAAFRTESSYETVTFRDENKIYGNDGGNSVVGAVQLSPGMRVKFLGSDLDVPLSVEAYTETGQKEVLFDEPDEGEIVETTLSGVAWFDINTVNTVDDRENGWNLEILPEA